MGNAGLRTSRADDRSRRLKSLRRSPLASPRACEGHVIQRATGANYSQVLVQMDYALP